MTDSSTDAKASTTRIGQLRASILEAGDTRITDAVLMALFIVIIPVPGTGIGINLVAAAALILLGSFRRPTRTLAGGYWYPVICVGTLAYLGVVAVLTGPGAEDVTRMGRIGLLMALAGFMATGRISIKSGFRGILLALAINVPLFYVGLAPDNYGGLLTGFLGDKNVAGLTYAIMTILFLLLTPKFWPRAFIVLGGTACVVLTDSRTSMAALAAGLIWLLLARYLGTFFRAILALGLYLAFEFAETNLAQAGAYAARSGSDELRERIDAASWEKVTATPWFGAGLGEGTVEVAGETWFFHNAYWGLWVDGGAPLSIAVLLLCALAGFQFLAKGRPTPESRIVEASMVTLLLCSFRLGETFFSIPGFLVIGVGLSVYLRRHGDWVEDQKALDARELKERVARLKIAPRMSRPS
ncbi:hypothetical protein C5E10_03130 [Pseudoclavibacter sp. RFBG4]|uniref:O-antigen ligase family protein n=1 Tax=Pseudoclavibacter sp. RFBG4 TaxID=2080575 RepID=UPI000CE87316|nr:O-antigen ligase family protein [Pseudoclavibacter sp. RFBG4]PPG35626.1 hypothetical protein C5E10_03130 [Pseudoclavibacter sp. RFBG4]